MTEQTTFVALTMINLYFIYTVKKMQCYFTFDYLISVLEHLEHLQTKALFNLLYIFVHLFLFTDFSLVFNTVWALYL